MPMLTRKPCFIVNLVRTEALVGIYVDVKNSRFSCLDGEDILPKLYDCYVDNDFDYIEAMTRGCLYRSVLEHP